MVENCSAMHGILKQTNKKTHTSHYQTPSKIDIYKNLSSFDVQ